MTYRVSAAAQQDLREIYRYTLREWGERQGDLYMAGLQTRFIWLVVNRPLWRERPELGAGIHTYAHERHVIVFRQIGDCLDILRVLHDRMELDGHIAK